MTDYIISKLYYGLVIYFSRIRIFLTLQGNLCCREVLHQQPRLDFYQAAMVVEASSPHTTCRSEIFLISLTPYDNLRNARLAWLELEVVSRTLQH